MYFTSDIIHRDSFIVEFGSHVRDSILIVLDGQFTCNIYGITHNVQKGDIFAFSKNTLFSRKVLVPIKCVYLQFSEFPIPLRSGFIHSYDPQRTENTILHLTKAVEERNHKLCEHFVWDILFLHRKQDNIPDPNDPIVSACITYFNCHLEEHIDLDILTNLLSISKQTLIRKFKQSTHKTPMEYLAFTRVNQSKLFLRDSSLSISEIAAKCGFETVYYFSNYFKKTVGMSPSAYRKIYTTEQHYHA